MRNLSEDLRDAWDRLRETATGFGEQRIYASHHSAMFARKAWYFFVRPKRNVVEVCAFADPDTSKATKSDRTSRLRAVRFAAAMRHNT
jgi:hypothetical protein